jgi:hypothetical protein
MDQKNNEPEIAVGALDGPVVANAKLRGRLRKKL